MLAHGATKSSVLLRGGFQADLRVVAAREPRRGAAVLHRLQGPQHRAARPGAAARLQAERVRAVPARRRRRRGRSGRRTTSTGRSGSRRSRRSCASTGARSRRPNRAPCRRWSRAATCAAICTCTPPPATAAPTSRPWRWRPRALGLSYIAITDHSQALAMANGLDERARPRARRADPRGQRSARRHHGAGGHRMRHPRRTARMDLADDCLAAARHRRRLGPLGVHPGAGADDRPPAARARLPVGRHPGPPDRAAAPANARATATTWSACSRRRPHAAWRSRSTARSIGSTCATRRPGWRGIAGVQLIIDSDAHSPAALAQPALGRRRRAPRLADRRRRAQHAAARRAAAPAAAPAVGVALLVLDPRHGCRCPKRSRKSGSCISPAPRRRSSGTSSGRSTCLKSLPTDADREKAAVYMEGLAEMRKEWKGRQRPPR